MIEEAIRNYLGLISGGALFPTDQERKTIDGLRALLPNHSEAVEAFHVLVTLAQMNPVIAEAVRLFEESHEMHRTARYTLAQQQSAVGAQHPQPEFRAAEPKTPYPIERSARGGKRKGRKGSG
jgi:hypothetical protein